MAAVKIVRLPTPDHFVMIDGEGKEIGFEVTVAKEKSIRMSDKSFRALCATVVAVTALIVGHGSFAKPVAVILRGMLQ